jgi:hypothetical protein
MAEPNARPSQRRWVIRFAIAGAVIGAVAGWLSFSGRDRWSGLALAALFGAVVGAMAGSGYESSLGSVLGWLRGESGLVPMSTEEAINLALFDLFRRHDVPAIYRGGVVVLPNRMRVSGSISNQRRLPNGGSVQLDVVFEFQPGGCIVESFVGLGETRQEAIAFAMNNFVVNSFHVFLAAFVRPGDEQVREEEWTIGGKPRRVVIGNLGIRGSVMAKEAQQAQLGACMQRFEERIQAQPPGPGTHWVRLFYAQEGGRMLAFEVLRDNAPWLEMQAEMAAVEWPATEEFYSVRNFLVIQDKMG